MNACGIIASSDVTNTVTLELASDNKTQSPSKTGYTGKSNT